MAVKHLIVVNGPLIRVLFLEGSGVGVGVSLDSHDKSDDMNRNPY